MLAWAVPGPALACSFALMFSVDASGSINSDEWRLQTEGLAEALDDPDIGALLVAQQLKKSHERVQDVEVCRTSPPPSATRPGLLVSTWRRVSRLKLFFGIG